MTRDVVLERAQRVLDANWTGTYTVPASGLYPHQWSWDSAFIAIGTRHTRPDRARAEILSLVPAQWDDGRIPQIIYNPTRDEEYAPGNSFWRSQSIPGSGVRPSAGFVQPPNHAWAAWLVHSADPEGSASEGFLEAIYPVLVRWHDYLAGPRASSRNPTLSVIKHPWEGTDNSPLWDDALSRVPVESGTEIRRPDLLHAGHGERPDTNEYRKYYWLAERYRANQCRDDEPFAFEMVCPLFNALQAVSELALARIADALGASSQAHRDRAAVISTALDSDLWDDELGIYVARDDVSGSLVRKATANGLAPLLIPDAGHGPELVATLLGPRFLGGGKFVPSYDRTAADFDPALYWRGPAWFNLNWMIMRAMQGIGNVEAADRLTPLFSEVSAQGDFPEYVDPTSGEPRGTRNFSWTAALTIDALTVTHLPPLSDTTNAPAPIGSYEH